MRTGCRCSACGSLSAASCCNKNGFKETQAELARQRAGMPICCIVLCLQHIKFLFTDLSLSCSLLIICCNMQMTGCQGK